MLRLYNSSSSQLRLQAIYRYHKTASFLSYRWVVGNFHHHTKTAVRYDTRIFKRHNFFPLGELLHFVPSCFSRGRMSDVMKSCKHLEIVYLNCHLVTKPLNRWRRSSYAAQLPWWLYPVPSFLSCFLVLNDDCSRLCKTKFISIGTSLNHLSLFNHKHIYCRKKERRRAIYLWWVCRVWEEIDSGYEDQYSFLKIRWSSGWSNKSC